MKLWTILGSATVALFLWWVLYETVRVFIGITSGVWAE